MIGQFSFSVLLGLAWLSEFAFGSVIVYWFVTQGLSDDEHTVTGTDIPLESRSSVLRSLSAWVVFFIVLTGLIFLAS